MRRRSVALLAAVVLLVLPILAAPALAMDPAKAKHDQTVAYWTPARIAAATPRDFVKEGSTFKPVKSSKGADGSKGKPPSGGGSTDPTVTGASWTKGGPILESTGKVVFTMDGSNWICSGTVIKDTRAAVSVVLTAGHCAYDEANHAFATNWMFIPNFDAAPIYWNCASNKYGCWTSDALVVHNGFATAGGFNTQATVHDFAFAIVGNGGKSGAQLDATVPAWNIAFNATSSGDQLWAFGYPAGRPYKGNDLTYCAGKIGQDGWNANLTWKMGCNMTGGSSGGPWIKGFSETATSASGAVSSLNSYGYSGVKSMFGPKFNSTTQAVYNAANSGGTTTNTIVN